LVVPRILAIGGGEIGRLETLELDAEVIRMAAKKRPRVLFVPTATADDPGYVAIVEEHYGRRLGCDVATLLLYDRTLSDGDLRRAIDSADIVYVGGGNTLRMMKLWRRLGVDRVLRQAAAEGTVIAGISAGAMCWCSSGVSDSRSFAASDESWDYITVRGLGLVDIVLCPHFDADPRRPIYAASSARRRRLTVLGLDDCTALQVVDGRWRILSSREGSMAHLVDRSGTVHDIAPESTFRPRPELTDRGRATARRG
jgi:dipeptidase E